MKNLFFVFLLAISLMSFTSSNEVKSDFISNDYAVSLESVDFNANLNSEIVCSVTCSVVVNGVTITTSAGNWFSSCERAGRRCVDKLNQMVQ